MWPDMWAGKRYKGVFEHPNPQILLVAKNYQGLRNLMKLSSLSMERLDKYVPNGNLPCVTFEELSEHRNHIACLTGHWDGMPGAWLNEDKNVGEAQLLRLQEIFGEELYLEVQDHEEGDEEWLTDSLINSWYEELSSKHGVKLIATNSGFYKDPVDADKYEVLDAIRRKMQAMNGTNKTPTSGFYLKSESDFLKSDLPQEAIDNVYALSEQIEDYGFDQKNLIVPYHRVAPDHYTYPEKAHEKLDGLCRDGMKRLNLEGKKEYEDRLEEELQMIESKDFSSYFLVVGDIMNWMRSKNIITPTGRGSAGGSLVCYLLDITSTDPIQLNLPFWRFISSARKDMPDIDNDVPNKHRKDILTFIRDTYGPKRVGQIATFVTMQPKNAIENVGRVLGVPRPVRDEVRAAIPFNAHSLTDHEGDELPLPGSPERVMMDQQPGWWETAAFLCGKCNNIGYHPAALVISNDPLEECSALMPEHEGYHAVQLDMHDAEDVGLLKLDMLGLRTLDQIKETFDQVERNYGDKLTMQSIPIDDSDVYAYYASGNYLDVFQSSKGGFRKFIKKLKPETIEHISAAVALYRPGPIESGFIDQYVERKNGREDSSPIHPAMEKFLEDTYGLIIYQEQCAAKGSPIWTKSGVKRIEDVNTDDFVLTSSGYQKVTATHNTGIKVCKKVKTSKGFLFLTEDHKVKIWDGSFKTVSELSKNDLLAYSHPEFSDSSEDITNDKLLEAYYLGVLVGDGCLGMGNVDIACESEEHADWMLSVLKPFYENCKKYLHTRCWHVAFSSKRIKASGFGARTTTTQFLEKHNLWRKAGSEKLVPKWVTSHRKLMKAFMIGWIDSDGSITNGPNHITCKTEWNRKVLLWMCDILGISSYERENRVYLGNLSPLKDVYNLIPHWKNIDFSNERTTEALVFSCKEIKDWILSQGISIRSWCEINNVNVSSLHTGNFVTERIFPTEVRKVIESFCGKYTRVLNIEEDVEYEVYDLTVDSIHEFNISGHIVHNCMQFAMAIGGLTDGEADKFRKAIGKKDKVAYDKLSDKILQGALAKGEDEKEMRELLGKMADFARYAFNRAHSASYGMNAYVTAYLEYYYPLEYAAATLNAYIDKMEDRKRLVEGAIRMGIRIVKPDVNKSNEMYRADPVDRCVYIGLRGVEGLNKAAEKIVKEREKNGPYKSYIDFMRRLPSVSKKVVENLIKIGAFTWDETISDVDKLDNIEILRKTLKKKNKSVDGSKLTDEEIMTFPGNEPALENKWFSPMQMSENEHKLLGFFTTEHPATVYTKLGDRIFVGSTKIYTPNDIVQGPATPGEGAFVVCKVDLVKPKETKKGKPYLMVCVSDQFSKLFFNIWSPECDEFRGILKEDTLVCLESEVVYDKFHDSNSIKLKKLYSLQGGIKSHKFIANQESDKDEIIRRIQMYTDADVKGEPENFFGQTVYELDRRVSLQPSVVREFCKGIDVKIIPEWR